ALAAATITVVGQNHGKGNLARIRKVNDVNIAAAIVVMAALAAVYSALSPVIFGAFSTSAEVVRWSTAQVRVLSFTFVGSAAAAVAAATVLAVGRPAQALTLAAVRAGLLSLPLAWLMAVVLRWGMPGVFAAVGLGNLAGLPVGWIWSRALIARTPGLRPPSGQAALREWPRVHLP
ncbi:MAG TPA: MATE family efflux transporter, partial [Spirochaetia bacterium]|nr:MATE family efflux transporter [Spirochaetia bacterium]